MFDGVINIRKSRMAEVIKRNRHSREMTANNFDRMADSVRQSIVAQKQAIDNYNNSKKIQSGYYKTQLDRMSREYEKELDECEDQERKIGDL